MKEELRQLKDREDRMHSQINQRLKQKTNDFDKLYREHKQTEADYKRLGLEFDRQQDRLKEMLKEVRTKLAKKTEALGEEKIKVVATAKLLEEEAKEKLELNRKHYEDTERAKLMLNIKTLNNIPTPSH